jgi:hypothetical protein
MIARLIQSKPLSRFVDLNRREIPKFNRNVKINRAVVAPAFQAGTYPTPSFPRQARPSRHSDANRKVGATSPQPIHGKNAA